MSQVDFWGEPIPVRWEVYCIDGHARRLTSSVFVRATSEQRAIATGKYWMRVICIKRRGTVIAKRYHPERDPAFQYGDWRVIPTPAVASGGAS